MTEENRNHTILQRLSHQIRENPVEALTNAVETLALGLVFMMGLQVVLSKFFPALYFFTTNEQKLAALFWGFFVLGSAVLLRLLLMRRRLDELRLQTQSEIEVLAATEIDVASMLSKARRVRILTLSGSVIAKLGEGAVRATLRETRADVSILIANPRSDAIQIRYAKDEPDTHQSGISGISRTLISLSKFRLELSPEQQRRIDIRVYDNYPSISLVQCDDDLYSTVYGFRLRGADCPRVRVDAETHYGRFLLSHFQTVYDASVPLEQWIENFGTSEAGSVDY